MNELQEQLPKVVLSMRSTFNEEQVLEQVHVQGVDPKVLRDEVKDFLNDLVWLGVLWKAGDDEYTMRARPHGI